MTTLSQLGKAAQYAFDRGFDLGFFHSGDAIFIGGKRAGRLISFTEIENSKIPVYDLVVLHIDRFLAELDQ